MSSQAFGRAVTAGERPLDPLSDSGLRGVAFPLRPQFTLSLIHPQAGADADARPLGIKIGSLGEGQPILDFQFLGRPLPHQSLVDAVPQLAIQTDAAGDDVDMLAMGIVVPNHHELMVFGIEAHFPHEGMSDLIPGFRGQMLSGGQ